MQILKWLTILLGSGLVLSLSGFGCSRTTDSQPDPVNALKAKAEQINRVQSYFHSLIEEKPGDRMTKRLAKKPTLDEMKQSIPFRAVSEGDEYSWTYELNGGPATWHAKFGTDGRLIWLRSPSMSTTTGYTKDWQKFENTFYG